MSKLKVGNKSGLKYFSYKDIQSWKPCYNSSKHLDTEWRGTAIDILKMDNIPFQDRLWCVLRLEICSERVMRLFAVWSYRQTLEWVKNPDPRSLAAADTAERYANGQATKEELVAAHSVVEFAHSAARYAAESAAWYATRYATRSAARSAEQEKQRDKLIEVIIAEGKERKAYK